MTGFEKLDKRLIRFGFAVSLTAVLSALYVIVWLNAYNPVLDKPLFRRGNWLMGALYGVLIFCAMKLYGGFKIGYLKQRNLLCSQLLTVVFADIFTYFQISVMVKTFPNIRPLMFLIGTDICILMIWTFLFQLLCRHIFHPARLLYVAGDHQDYHLIEKINSRKDKYLINRVIRVSDGLGQICSCANEYDAVFIGDIPSHERNVLLKYCFRNSIRSYSIPKISDILIRSSEELDLFDSPLLLSRNIGLSSEQKILKRGMDLVGSAIGIVVLFPLFLIIGSCIYLNDRGPVFYCQDRLTRDGTLFRIYKFRTMIKEAEKEGNPILAKDHDPRVFPVGGFLRRSRLDELPQLFNILKGEMSLVGPRPERPKLAEKIEEEIPEFSMRLKMKAGLTGYAQIYGKYNTSSYDKLKLDLVYMRNYSFLLDLKLIFMTPKILLLKESAEGVRNNDG